MRVVTFCLVACAAFLLPTLRAEASQPIGCDAVKNMATVEADDTLSVTVVKDIPTKTCVFHVELPPTTAASATPQQKAAELARRFFAKPDEKQIAEQFAPALQDALFYPVKLGNFEPGSFEAWANAIGESKAALTACLVDTLAYKKDFAYYSDAIGCGPKFDKRYFVVETKSPTLSSALFLPLSNK
jgi:hypothetical protein